jgi:flagellar basal body-associated protein FliL
MRLFVCSPVSTSQNLPEAVKMKKELKIILSAMVSLILVAAICALPVTVPSNTATHEQTAAATQSVSGKITSVEKTSFTLNIGPSHTNSNLGQQLQDSSAKTMTFQIDKNTTVDGKLQVGANADVTYREDGGKLLAISVRVS